MNKANVERVAVFLPSEIYTMKRPNDTVRPEKVLYEDSGTEMEYAYYSTGRLEAALAQGYDVWVLDATPHGRPYSDWWKQLVQPDHILDFHGYEDMESGTAKDSLMELFSKLGLPWDETLKFWASHLNALPGYGVSRGCRIEPLKTVA